MPNEEPVVVTSPKPFFSKKPKITALFLGCILLIISLFLLNQFGIISISKYISSPKPSQVAEKVIAEVDDEKIYPKELEDAKGLFSSLRGKNATDSAVQKEALDFVINYRLLKKEAKKRNLDVTGKVNERLTNSIGQFANQKNLESNFHTNIATYTNYLLYQTVKEAIEPSVSQWRVVDYLSIRYLWHDNPETEEKEFKKIASNKIQEYHQKIKNGFDIKEAIKQRCKDPTIDYLPYLYDDKYYHIKIYPQTFDGQVCRDQRINSKLSKDTNPDWGDGFLKEVFKYHKGELSPVIDFSKENVGMFFIVKVLDEGVGNNFSFDDFMEGLKKEARIKIYE